MTIFPGSHGKVAWLRTRISFRQPAPVTKMVPILPSLSDIARHDVLGGLIHEYCAAAQASVTPTGLPTF